MVGFGSDDVSVRLETNRSEIGNLFGFLER